MAGSTNGATMLASSLVPLERLPIAIAVLPTVNTNRRCGSSPFTADIDAAEKGIHTSLINPDRMKRTSTTNKPAANPEHDPVTQQASTTGVDRYAEVETRIKSSIGQELREIIKEPTITINPTKSSTSSEDRGTTSSDTRTSEKGPGSTGNSNVVDTGYDRFIRRHYESYPLGFPRLAAFQNSAESVAITRRFGTVHARLLLHLSCEITSLERQLTELDEVDSKTSMVPRLRGIGQFEGCDTAQKELIDQLKLKVSEYDDLALKCAKMQSLKPARVRDHLSLFNWIYKHKPLYRGHYDFVYHCDDFVSLANQPENKFEDAVKSCLDRWPGSRFQQFLRDEDEAPGVQDQHVYFFSTDKIARVGKIMAVCMAVTIVLIPVFLLFLTELSKKATSIMVLVFVLSFAALMSLLTGARVESVFAATCAYCAVLVTFLGNMQGTCAVTS